MTPKEFKAWFEGFTEAMEGQPSPQQWEKIKQRVSEIDGTPVTERHYIDRYWPQPKPMPWAYQRWHETYCAGKTGGGQLWNSITAMADLGKSEYRVTS